MYIFLFLCETTNDITPKSMPTRKMYESSSSEDSESLPCPINKSMKNQGYGSHRNQPIDKTKGCSYNNFVNNPSYRQKVENVDVESSEDSSFIDNKPTYSRNNLRKQTENSAASYSTAPGTRACDKRPKYSTDEDSSSNSDNYQYTKNGREKGLNSRSSINHLQPRQQSRDNYMVGTRTPEVPCDPDIAGLSPNRSSERGTRPVKPSIIKPGKQQQRLDILFDQLDKKLKQVEKKCEKVYEYIEKSDANQAKAQEDIDAVMNKMNEQEKMYNDIEEGIQKIYHDFQALPDNSNSYFDLNEMVESTMADRKKEIEDNLKKYLNEKVKAWRRSGEAGTEYFGTRNDVRDELANVSRQFNEAKYRCENSLTGAAANIEKIENNLMERAANERKIRQERLDNFMNQLKDAEIIQASANQCRKLEINEFNDIINEFNALAKSINDKNIQLQRKRAGTFV